MQTDIDKMGEYLKDVPGEQVGLLVKYFNSLIYFNSKVNLVSSSTLPFAAKQHFADSVYGLKIAMDHAAFNDCVYDFGSGNGFPGIVLAVLRSDLPVCLVERDARKAEFLKHVAAELSLKNINVHAQAIDTLKKDSITLGITRALGSISNVLIQTNALFKSGGSLFHFKADSWSSEIASCPTQVFTNWDIQSIGQYALPDSSVDRFIISSKKY